MIFSKEIIYVNRKRSKIMIMTLYLCCLFDKPFIFLITYDEGKCLARLIFLFLQIK